MALELKDIPRVKNITKEVFLRDYYKPQKPVVIERFIEDWPAFTKWNLDY
ncbi:MAG TPA: cupin-like domain-containing protein, partial [Aquaticitalea sp.]|nr:cupin-like domain-containing protein [Aquaticitalea sp.]